MRQLNTKAALISVAITATSMIANAAPAPAVNAGVLEEITVTATKRTENLKDVPISIAVVSGDALAADKLQSLNDMAGYVPNVLVTEGTISNAIMMRGVGSGTNVGFEQSVATFEDGVYHGRAKYSQSSFVDVAQLEVLRGPQSTYFGNNAIGGAFSVTTRRPGKEWESQVSSSYEFNAREAVVEIGSGGPVSDTVGLRLAGRFSNMEGWLDNLTTGQRNPGDTNKFGRATLVWQAAQDWVVTLKGEYGKDTGRAPAATHLTNCPPASAYPQAVWGSQLCGAALALHEGSPSSTQRYALAGEGLNVDSRDVLLNIEHKGVDGPGFSAQIANTHYNYASNGAPGNLSIPWFQYSDFEKYDQSSIELKLTSPESSKIKYIVGLYGMDNKLDVHTPVIFSFLTPIINYLETVPAGFGGLPPGLLSSLTPLAADVALNQHESAYSAFGALTYPLADKLSGTVGFRWTHSNKTGTQTDINETAMDNFGVTGTPIPATLVDVGGGYMIPLAQVLASAFTTYTNHSLPAAVSGQAFLPSASLVYKWTDDVSTYASYTKGWKAGGIDGSYTGSDTTAPLVFGPESVNSYEIGLKSYWLDHRLSLNVTIFDGVYSNLQQGVTVSTTGASGAQTTSVHTTNVGGLTSRGVELEANWAVSSIWHAGINLAYLDAAYTDYSNAGCTQLQKFQTPVTVANPTGLCTQDLSGVAPAFAPKYTGSASVGFVQPVGASLSVAGDIILSVSDKYDQLGVNDPLAFQAAWHKLDVRLGFGDRTKWQISALVKNVTNVQTSSAWNPAVFGTGSYTSISDRGRQIVIQGMYKW